MQRVGCVELRVEGLPTRLGMYVGTVKININFIWVFWFLTFSCPTYVHTDIWFYLTDSKCVYTRPSCWRLFVPAPTLCWHWRNANLCQCWPNGTLTGFTSTYCLQKQLSYTDSDMTLANCCSVDTPSVAPNVYLLSIVLILLDNGLMTFL